MAAETGAEASAEMRGSAAAVPLTMIVACSPANGIGRGGTLPWRLKNEMAYFKAVTLAAPPSSSHASSSASASGSSDAPRAKNALLMGRNTWESIPNRFRPLPERLNVVVSTKASAQDMGIDSAASDAQACSSLAEAASVLRARQSSGTAGAGRVFLMGGAQLYNRFLRAPDSDGFALERLLVTRVRAPAFDDCDTFLHEFRTREQVAQDAAPGAEPAQTQAPPTMAWRKAPHEELLAWLGEAATEQAKAGAEQREGDVSYELQMWLRA